MEGRGVGAATRPLPMFARRRPAPPAEAAETERPRAPGTVTRLVAQVHDAERVSVFLDGAFAFGVHRDLVLERGLRKGLALAVDEQESILAADALLRARSAALGFLSSRARTRREVADRLRRDDLSDDAIEDTLAWLDGRGYLDDAAYAAQYAESRRRAQGLGPSRIRQELRRRGVGTEEANEAVADVFDDPEAILDDALTAARKRLPSLLREPDPRKRQRKLYDFLARRGYDGDTSRQVIAAILSGDDAADDDADGETGESA